MAGLFLIRGMIFSVEAAVLNCSDGDALASTLNLDNRKSVFPLIGFSRFELRAEFEDQATALFVEHTMM